MPPKGSHGLEVTNALTKQLPAWMRSPSYVLAGLEVACEDGASQAEHRVVCDAEHLGAPLRDGFAHLICHQNDDFIPAVLKQLRETFHPLPSASQICRSPRLLENEGVLEV